MNTITVVQIEDWIALLKVDGANSKEHVINSMKELNQQEPILIGVTLTELDLMIRGLGYIDDDKYDDTAEILQEQLDIIFCSIDAAANEKFDGGSQDV